MKNICEMRQIVDAGLFKRGERVICVGAFGYQWPLTSSPYVDRVLIFVSVVVSGQSSNL